MDFESFRRKKEKTLPLRVKVVGKVFISRQNQHFCLLVRIIEVNFSISTLICRANTSLFPARENVKLRETKVQFSLILLLPLILLLFS